MLVYWSIHFSLCLCILLWTIQLLDTNPLKLQIMAIENLVWTYLIFGQIFNWNRCQIRHPMSISDLNQKLYFIVDLIHIENHCCKRNAYPLAKLQMIQTYCGQERDKSVCIIIIALTICLFRTFAEAWSTYTRVRSGHTDDLRLPTV